MRATQQRKRTATGTGEPVSASAEKLAGELKKLSDTILVRNHRATAEVMDAVKLVAGELERTSDVLKTSASALAILRDEATMHGHLALLEAKDKLTLLDDLVRTALAGAAHSPTFIGEAARLKLALARMDAADLFEEKRRLVLEERRRVESMADAALREIDNRLSELSAAANGAREPGVDARASQAGAVVRRLLRPRCGE